MTRCYLNGVEVDKVRPPLPFLADDDWLEKFLKWVRRKHPTQQLFLVLEDGRDELSNVEEVWVGMIPEWRRIAVGNGRIRVLGQNQN